jgi:hypothetical protein
VLLSGVHSAEGVGPGIGSRVRELRPVTVRAAAARGGKGYDRRGRDSSKRGRGRKFRGRGRRDHSAPSAVTAKQCTDLCL